MRALQIAVFLVLVSVGGCMGGTDEALGPSTGAPWTFSNTTVFPGEYDTSGEFARTLHEGSFDSLPPQRVQLDSDVDGAIIDMMLYRPTAPDDATVPVIAMASPYFDDDISPNEFLAENGYAQDHFYGEELIVNYPPHGYALAYIAVRGSGESGGCLDAFGANEQADLDQAVTWLGTQPWSNGNVGMVGLSYDGTTPWMVAATGNPHLKTIVPISGANDLFGLSMRNGTWMGVGAASTAFYYALSNGNYRTDPPVASDLERRIETALCPEVVESLGPSARGAMLTERDTFWEQRNYRPEVAQNYEGSIFLVHGFHDLNVPVHQAYPLVNALAANGTVVKHLLGPWRHTFPDWPVDDPTSANHNPTPRFDFAEILLHWFDRWLKQNVTADIGPAVQVADTDGRWRSETAWPPADSLSTIFHLTPEGGIDREESAETGSFLVGPDAIDIALPKDRSPFPPDGPCPTCAVFSTEALDKEMRFAGAPHPHIAVTPQGPGGYLTAALWRLDADGGATLLTDGAMDLRFAAGGERPQPVSAGKTIIARMELDHIDAVLPVESRLVLVVAEGKARDDQRGVEAQTTWPNRPPMPIQIEVGAGQSILVLRTFDRGSDVFFAAPGFGTGGSAG